MKAEPATAVAAAAGAVDVLITLADACTAPGTPASAHVETLRILRDVVKVTGDLIPIEARLAARVLIPPDPETGSRPGGTVSEPAEATSVRRWMHTAADNADCASSALHSGWKQGRRVVEASRTEPDGDGGRVLRLARAAERSLSELEDALADADQGTSRKGPAWLAGHRSITQALYLSAGRLVAVCDNLYEPVRISFAELGPAGRKQQAAIALFTARNALRTTRAELRRADTALAAAWERSRSAQRKTAAA